MPTQLPRALPHSLEAEALLLSCLIIDGPALMAFCLDLRMSPAHFYGQEHQTIFRRLLDMYQGQREMAAETLLEELRTHRELEQVGGIEGLLRITSRAATTVRATYFAQQIANYHTLRVMIRESTLLIEKCHDSTVEDVAADLAPPVERMLSILAGSVPDREPTFPELVGEAEHWLAELEANAGKPSTSIVPFPFPAMNAAFEPMQRGQLVVIGAKTSVGKSSLSRQLAAHCAMHTGPVYFVTLEVNPRQVVLQMAASLARVGLRELPRASAADWVAVKQALRDMRSMGMHVSRKDRTIAAICAKAKIYHAQRALAMIVVDYGGLIDDIACAKPGDQVQAIGAALKALKRLAIELDCVVVVPWQLNRKSSYEGNREPRLSDLRQSGDVEQDTDKVIFLHRPEINPLTKLEQAETSPKHQVPRFYQEVIQAKGRDDGTGRIGLYFQRALASFVSIAQTSDDRPEF